MLSVCHEVQQQSEMKRNYIDFQKKTSNIKMKSQRNNKNEELERKIQRKGKKMQDLKKAWTLIGDRKVSEGKSLCHSMLFADLWPIVQ